jgi:hypothetical protein
MMSPETIERIALDNGFVLKEQPDGSMALNPYVYDFARALLATPVDYVKIPNDANEAELMAKLSMIWLEQNAPERLKAL